MSYMTTADVAAHYDDLDLFYREIWGEHVHHGLWLRGDESSTEAVLNLVDLVADSLQLKAGAHIGDIGCGYGATSRLFVQRWGAKVSGWTVSKAQMTYAQGATIGNNPEYFLEDWLDAKNLHQAFDGALAIESTEHMSSLAGFFAQARLALKPGGRLSICAWLADDAPSAFAKKHFLGPICAEGRLVAMRSAAEFRRAAAAHGFENIVTRDLSLLVKKTWLMCARRVFARFFSDRRYRRFVFDRRQSNRVFALTLLRILAAYELKIMRYGLITMAKS